MAVDVTSPTRRTSRCTRIVVGKSFFTIVIVSNNMEKSEEQSLQRIKKLENERKKSEMN